MHNCTVSRNLFFLIAFSFSIFTAIFPGEPMTAGFIAAKDYGSRSDNWSCKRTKLQSNRHHQQTNTQLFTGRMSFLSLNQQCQSTERKISHSMDLLTSNSPWESFNLSLTTKGSWLPWRRVVVPLVSPLTPVPHALLNNIDHI